MDPSFPRVLTQALRQMDQEATGQTFYGGQPYPTGLRSYDTHVRPNLEPSRSSQYHTEDAWADRLKELIEAHAAIARVEVRPRYPTGSFADLKIEFRDGTVLWNEMKAVKKYDRFVPSEYVVNGWYCKHLTSPTEGVPHDFDKLRALRKPSADFISVLVVGFDIEGCPELELTEADMGAMRANAGLHGNEWSCHYAEWPDQQQLADVARHGVAKGIRVRCWFWWRDVR